MARFIRLPLITRRSTSADVDEEIQSHLGERVRQLIASGMTPDAARAEALRRFGDIATTRRVMRHSAQRHAGRLRRHDRLGAIAQDARHTLRQFRRAPALTASIIVTLGLGIGATATMFGVVDRLLLRPPAHVRDPGTLGRLYTSHLDGNNRAVDQPEVSYLRYTQLRDGARHVVDIAALGDMPIIAGRGTASRRISGAFVSGNFWSILGVRPFLGRFFTPDEDAPPDGSDVVVLGHAYWKGALGADSSVIGRPIDLGSRRFTIIGVAPRDFHGVRPGRIDVWLPVMSLRARETALPPDWHANLWWLALVARLRPEATRAQAEAVLTSTFARVHMGKGIPDATVRERARVVFGPLLEERGPTRQERTRVAAWLAVIAGIVLLLACANVANLLLVRAIRRRREIAVRIALGVRRGRLLGQLLVEGAILAGAGAVLGVAIAVGGGRLLWAFFLPDLARSETIFDARVLAFAIVAAVLAGVLASLAPALYAMRQDVGAMMKTSAPEASRKRPSLRTLLLVGQPALSTALLLGAGLFIRSLQLARTTPLGFDARSLITVRAEQRDGTLRPGGMTPLYREFAERVRGVPGVIAAATTTQVPFSISGDTYLSVPGVDSATLEGLRPIRMNPVGPGYFETMGTRILRGRALTAQDGATSQRVMVVSDSMARALWPGADALGRCVKVGGDEQPCSIVVGVAENIHQYEVRAEPALQYWFPESQAQGGNSGALAVMVRVAGDAAAVVPTIRRVLQQAAPPGTYVSVTAVGAAVDRVIRPWRLGAVVLSAFGLLGLIIAGMGLYSVLAYTVSQRVAELGLRMALGARAPSVVLGVVASGLRVTAVGIALGLGVAAAAGSAINPVLFGVKTTDPLVMPLVVLTLLGVALVASAIPAWRASRVDPAQVLRAE